MLLFRFASAVAPIADGGGGSAGVMNSFSHVNGVAMPANKKYMDMLREDFGFGNGLIVTDWGSIAQYEKGDKQVPNQPNCNGTLCVAQRAATCLKAGTDMDLRGGFQALPESLKLGFISEADIDRALNRSLSLSFQLGRFEPPGVVPFHKVHTRPVYFGIIDFYLTAYLAVTDPVFGDWFRSTPRTSAEGSD